MNWLAPSASPERVQRSGLAVAWLFAFQLSSTSQSHASNVATQPPGGLPERIAYAAAVAPRDAHPGQVVVSFVISPTGEVFVATVLAGDSRIARSATSAVRQWKFTRRRRGATALVSVGVGQPDATNPVPLVPVTSGPIEAPGGTGGTVVLRIRVGPDGSVESATGVGGLTRLRPVAEAAVARWRYPRMPLAYQLTVAVAVGPSGFD